MPLIGGSRLVRAGAGAPNVAPSGAAAAAAAAAAISGFVLGGSCPAGVGPGQFAHPCGVSANGTEADREFIAPFAMTLLAIYALNSVVIAGTPALVVRVNGASSVLATAAWVDSDPANTPKSGVGSVAVAAGDRISLTATSNNFTGRWGIKAVPA